MAAKPDTRALMIFLNNREVLDVLSDEQRGQVVTALLDYLELGKKPSFTGEMNVSFIVLRKDVDQSVERWEAECRRRSEAGKKSAAVRAAKKFQQEVSCEDDLEEAQDDRSASSEAEDPSAIPEDGNESERRSAEFNSAEQRSTEAAYTYSNSNPYPNPYPNPNPYPHPNTKKKRSARGQSVSGDFERFWQAYPRKVAKQAARRAFARVDVPLERLLQALEQQKTETQWQRENGRYIPHPVTWLNQGRWEDEPTDATAPCAQYRVESL